MENPALVPAPAQDEQSSEEEDDGEVSGNAADDDGEEEQAADDDDAHEGRNASPKAKVARRGRPAVHDDETDDEEGQDEVEEGDAREDES